MTIPPLQDKKKFEKGVAIDPTDLNARNQPNAF